MNIAVVAATLCLAACEQPASQAETALFISPSQYTPYGIDAPVDEAKYVKVTRTINTDLTISLEYTYDPPDGTKGIRYMTQEIDKDYSSADNFITGAVEDTVENTLYSAKGLTIEETKEYPYNSGTRTFVIRNKEDNVVGNLLRVSWGKVSYKATIIGAYLNDTNAWEAIFDEKLRAIEKFQW
jgi:hypothetical protein